MVRHSAPWCATIGPGQSQILRFLLGSRLEAWVKQANKSEPSFLSMVERNIIPGDLWYQDVGDVIIKFGINWHQSVSCLTFECEILRNPHSYPVGAGAAPFIQNCTHGFMVGLQARNVGSVWFEIQSLLISFRIERYYPIKVGLWIWYVVQSILIFHLFRHNSEISHIVGFTKNDQKKKTEILWTILVTKLGEYPKRYYRCIAPVRRCHRGLNDGANPCTDGYGHLGHPYFCLLGGDHNTGGLFWIVVTSMR